MLEFKNSEIHRDEEKLSSIPPSFYLSKKETKMAYGDLVNKNGTILFNNTPVDGIQGIVIISGNPIIVINETTDNWILRCSELGDFELHIFGGKERRKFISCNEKDMQIFINFGYGGREILLALDTKLYERGCFVNKGPKAADQIEILYRMLIQYFLAVCTNSNCESNGILPPYELSDTQKDSNMEGNFSYGRF